MVTCYGNKCCYSCSGTNNIINIKKEHESHLKSGYNPLLNIFEDTRFA